MARQLGAFDLSDVAAQLDEVEWLRRQCRRLLDQRAGAFRLGYRSALEDLNQSEHDHDPVPG